jgi:hypothetical protein
MSSTADILTVFRLIERLEAAGRTEDVVKMQRRLDELIAAQTPAEQPAPPSSEPSVEEPNPEERKVHFADENAPTTVCARHSAAAKGWPCHICTLVNSGCTMACGACGVVKGHVGQHGLSKLEPRKPSNITTYVIDIYFR